MPARFGFLLPLLRAAVLGLVLGAPCRGAVADGGDPERFFEQRIRPVLVEHCFECHSTGSAKLKGGLRLDSRAGLLTGGDSGPAVVPGQPTQSLLVAAVQYRNPDRQMPPKHALAAPVVADLVSWVQQGAVYPAGASNGPAAPVTAANPSAPSSHWAFQPIRDGSRPADAGLAIVPVGHPVDRFIHATLAAHQLTPAPPADRRILIRRASYDLLGLPPTPEEVAAFVADPSPDAFPRLVDRLLASPHYGERWGRWWLDVARYADTNGQDENKVMSNAWRYRDWVIRSFNAGMPFDQFAVAQLAGDLLPTNGVPVAEIFDRWLATGFLVLGPKMLAEQDKPKLIMDIVDEQIDVVSRAFLGLTVGCARCHDHKFDPVSARDYYALAGIFKSTRTMENLGFVSKPNERPVATPAELAAIAASQQALRMKSNELAAVIGRANAAWLDERKRQLGQVLAVAGRTPQPSAGNGLDSNLLSQVVAWMAPDPATDTLSRTLRRLAAAPDPSAALAQALVVAPNTVHPLAPGRVGAAFVATGSNHLDLPHAAVLEPAQLTVEAWVRAPEFPGGGDARRWLVSKNANEWAEGYYALMLDRRRPGAYLNIGGGQEHVLDLWSDGPELQTNQWYHLAFTYDGTTLRLFVDGEARGTRVIRQPRRPGTGPLALGRRPDGYNYFRGQLDEVRVYDRALSGAELKAHFDRPEQVAETGAVARWEFNALSAEEQQVVAGAELREVLGRPGGVWALPADPRPAYPEATRDALLALERERDQLLANAPPPAAQALAVDEAAPVDLPVHIRGSHLNLAKELVPRGFLHAVPPQRRTSLPPERSGRLELAQWLIHPENSLTARVIVNRIWQAHFGEGLVRTPDNFGLRGEVPSHPELLDWLAHDFVTRGWDVKALHRLILTSATWQQSSLDSGAGREVDPDNRWLAHFPRQRLEAEMIRDALLAVSGRMDPRPGGSIVAWKNDEYAPHTEDAARSVRRSVYLPIVRDLVYDVFAVFDFANPSVGVAKRVPTVVSHQALFFMNSPLVKASARSLAERLLQSAGPDDTARVTWVYQWTLNRVPTAPEADRVRRFLTQAAAVEPKADALETWSLVCQTLLAANEFVYRD